MGAAPVAQLGADLANGLDCAHQAGVVHRDLKPGNVLVEATGRARLIDFGIATGEHAAAVTHTGMVVGTPAYLAPEQVDGGRATPASEYLVVDDTGALVGALNSNDLMRAKVI